MSGRTVCHEPGTTTTLTRMGQEEGGPEEEGRERARGAVYSEDGRSRSELGKGVASRS